MTIVEKSFERMLEEIEFNEWVLYHRLVPERMPNHFVREKLKVNGNGIREYEFPSRSYVQTLADLLAVEQVVLSEIFYNAFGRGNKGESYLAVTVHVFKGRQGYVLRVRDSGGGFNFHNGASKEGNGGGTATLEGNIDCEISYEGNGSIVNLMHKVSKDQPLPKLIQAGVEEIQNRCSSNLPFL